MTKNLYRIYIDESGDHTYGEKNISTLRIKSKEQVIEIPFDDYVDLEDNRKRYLSLTGCIIKRDFYDTAFCHEIDKLKRLHFEYDPDDPLIFHREDIVHKRGVFYRLKDPDREVAFNVDFMNFVENMEYKIVTVVIDKKNHIEKYGDKAYHPYHYCLTAILERYCGFLNFRNAKGDVLAESRGGKEDNKLKIAYQDLFNKGSRYMESSLIQQTLTSKKLKLKKKRQNIAGLQLADLLAHPLKQHILMRHNCIPSQNNFGSIVTQLVISKFNRQEYSGKIDGYGRVFLK